MFFLPSFNNKSITSCRLLLSTRDLCFPDVSEWANFAKLSIFSTTEVQTKQNKYPKGQGKQNLLGSETEYGADGQELRGLDTTYRRGLKEFEHQLKKK
jgi:hypothetical protein